MNPRNLLATNENDCYVYNEGGKVNYIIIVHHDYVEREICMCQEQEI